ncbi:MAG: VOC family protein [Planctomycetota bacterium]
MQNQAHFIFYVSDQQRSRDFYVATLAQQPRLDVCGMTEFTLATGVVLGLMPQTGIAELLGDALPQLRQPLTEPRAELYLTVADPQSHIDRAIAAGGRLLSPLLPRDWGDKAGYLLDPDQHVLAFATSLNEDTPS